MYLSKLELVGFKSFPQKTNFVFSDGITSIVGPNGCGKTNIVDAIRWVLGEQKTAVLRSDAMENVIFNGTKSRKQLGMAEVAMTLVNNKGILPTEYSEVTVTRRLFRSGESQYLLNKSKCRLKDIVELFMDTGMAADSYSVIELKMIDAILSGRVDERRHLIEEAAGVNKYKARRKEAVRKLNAVQDDITRVEDIIAEVQKNVNSLYRQASKTRRFNKLTNQLKEIDLKVLQHEYHFFTKEIEEYRQKAGTIKEEKTKAINELEEIERHTNELREKKHILSEQLHTAQEKEAVLSASIAQKKQDIAVWKEKLSNSTSTGERLRKEIEDTKEYQSKTNSNLADAREQIENLEKEKSKKEQELETIRAQKDEVFEKVREKREASSDAHEELINLQNKIQTLREQQKTEEHKVTSLKNKIVKAEDEIRSFERQAEEHDKNLQILSGEKEKLDNALEIAEENLGKGQSKKLH